MITTIAFQRSRMEEEIRQQSVEIEYFQTALKSLDVMYRRVCSQIFFSKTTELVSKLFKKGRAKNDCFWLHSELRRKFEETLFICVFLAFIQTRQNI